MKKTLLLLASAAMLLVGCAKETLSPEAGDGEMVNMTVTASVQGEELTKAAVDNDGMGVHADRCIMVLYYGDKVYGRYQATVSGYHATFDVKVPAKRTYKAVFWADCAAEDGGDLYYNTADLKNITLKSDYVGNNDKRDAFFKCKEYTVENKSQSFTAELTRPFAQINVISNDIKDIHLVELYPKKVNLSFSAPTSFNAMSGVCGTSEAITYEADVYKVYDSAKTQLTLSMDYLFASTEQGAVDIEFKAPTEGELKVEYSFTNIPYQRNYRTNIIGNLLTADAHWDVTINPEWNTPEYFEELWAAGMITPVTPVENVYTINRPSELAWIAQQVNAGNTFTGKTVKLAKDIDLNNGKWTPIGNVASYPSITFAGTFDGNGKTISNLNVSDFTVENASAGLFGSITGTVKNVTVKNAVVRSSHYAAVICGYSSANACIIDNCRVEDATVTSVPERKGSGFDNGDKAGGIIGYIAVGDKVQNCSVENVTVTAHRDLGAVVGCAIYGAAAGVTSNTAKNCTVHQSNENGYQTGVTTYGKIIGRHNNDVPTNNVATNVELVSYDLEIYTVADLFEFAERVNAGTFSGKKAILMNDINLNNAVWTPVGTASSKFGGIFEGNGKVISNFTVTSNSSYAGLFGAVFDCSISNLTVSDATVSNTGENYSGVLVGSGYAHISNCTVKNSSVTGVDQVGAVIGYLSCGYVKNSVVENVNVTANGDRAGGITGKANVDSQYEISGNTVRNSTIVATSKVDNFRSAAALVGQIMASATNSWKIIDNTIINVSTKTGDDVLFVPVGEFRNGSFQSDAVSAGHIAGNKWQVEGAAGTYILYNPANTEQYVVINNAESDN